MRRWGALLVVGMVLAACEPTPGPAPQPSCGTSTAVVSSDGNHLVELSGRTDLGVDNNGAYCDIFITNLASGVTSRVSSTSAQLADHLDVSADGRFVLSTGVGGNSSLFDSVTGAQLWTMGYGVATRPADLSDDGQWITYVRSYGNSLIRRWNRVTGQETDIAWGGYEPRISGDGSKVAFTSCVDPVNGALNDCFVYQWDAATGAFEQLASDPNGAGDLEMSRDGNAVVFTDWVDGPGGQYSGGSTVISVWRRGTGVTRITDLPDTVGITRLPKLLGFTTDGAWVLFDSDAAWSGEPAAVGPFPHLFGFGVSSGQLIRVQPVGPGWSEGPLVNGWAHGALLRLPA